MKDFNSLEQQFAIRSFELTLRGALAAQKNEEVIELCVSLYKLYLVTHEQLLEEMRNQLPGINL